MPLSTAPRVQLVVSGKFIALLLIAFSLLGGGYYWYTERQKAEEQLRQSQERFRTPPYFVNRGASVLRSCQHCLETAGKLKPQSGWKVWSPQEIPATEQHWFLAVEDPPLPVTVAGVLMLPAHPALKDNPTLGFDMTHVVLVLYQNLERKSSIEQLLPVPAPLPPDPPKPSPTEPDTGADTASRSSADDSVFKAEIPFVGAWRNTDPSTKSLTRLVITRGGEGLAVHAWANCRPVDCDWGDSPSLALRPVSEGYRIVWDHKYALHTQVLTFEGQDYSKLRVSMTTHFTDNSGRRDLEIISWFNRAPTAP